MGPICVFSLLHFNGSYKGIANESYVAIFFNEGFVQFSQKASMRLVGVRMMCFTGPTTESGTTITRMSGVVGNEPIKKYEGNI